MMMMMMMESLVKKIGTKKEEEKERARSVTIYLGGPGNYKTCSHLVCGLLQTSTLSILSVRISFAFYNRLTNKNNVEGSSLQCYYVRTEENDKERFIS